MGQIKNIKLHIVTDIKRSRMSMKLKSVISEDDGGVTLHSVAAQIDFNGEANVKQYFQINPTTKSEAGKIKTTFRGRPLRGKKVDIPAPYTGFVANKKRDTFSDQQEQTLYVEKTFSSFTCWNLETPPTANDVMVKVCDWMEIADVIHAPVYIEEEKENCENVTPSDEKPVAL